MIHNQEPAQVAVEPAMTAKSSQAPDDRFISVVTELAVFLRQLHEDEKVASSPVRSRGKNIESSLFVDLEAVKMQRRIAKCNKCNRGTNTNTDRHEFVHDSRRIAMSVPRPTIFPSTYDTQLHRVGIH
jgi:hypothetical protein